MAKSSTSQATNPTLEVAQELSNLRKLPLFVFDESSITPASAVLAELQLDGKDFPEMDVVIHTRGGQIEPAFNIIKLIRGAAKKVNIIVPHRAKSAGTLMALCGDCIVLNITSELGPLDTQVRESQDGDANTYRSALNGFKALEEVQKHALANLDIAAKLVASRSGLKMAEAVKLAIEFSGKTSSCLYNQLNPVTIGEYARALKVGEEYGITILTRYLGWTAEKAGGAIKKLVYEYPSHGYIIDSQELHTLGFTVISPTPEESDLMSAMKLTLFQKDAEEGRSNITLILPKRPRKAKVAQKKNEKNK